MPGPSKAMLTEGYFKFKKTNPAGKCWVYGCNQAVSSASCLCHKHRLRRWRAKSKRTADFCALRDHAQARGLEFDITLDYWVGLTDAFGFYISTAECLTIDRVDASKGYVEGNLRVISLSANSRKSNRERYLPAHVQSILDRRRKLDQKKLAQFTDIDYSRDGQEQLPLDEASGENDDYNPF